MCDWCVPARVRGSACATNLAAYCPGLRETNTRFYIFPRGSAFEQRRPHLGDDSRGAQTPGSSPPAADASPRRAGQMSARRVCVCVSPRRGRGPARQELALTCPHLARFPQRSAASMAKETRRGRGLIAGEDTVNSYLDAHAAQRPSLPSLLFLSFFLNYKLTDGFLLMR